MSVSLRSVCAAVILLVVCRRWLLFASRSVVFYIYSKLLYNSSRLQKMLSDELRAPFFLTEPDHEQQDEENDEYHLHHEPDDQTDDGQPLGCLRCFPGPRHVSGLPALFDLNQAQRRSNGQDGCSRKKRPQLKSSFLKMFSRRGDADLTVDFTLPPWKLKLKRV